MTSDPALPALRRKYAFPQGTTFSPVMWDGEKWVRLHKDRPASKKNLPNFNVAYVAAAAAVSQAIRHDATVHFHLSDDQPDSDIPPRAITTTQNMKVFTVLAYLPDGSARPVNRQEYAKVTLDWAIRHLHIYDHCRQRD